MFTRFQLKTHFGPLLGASWGVSGGPFWLKQGRLGAPRRPKTVLDYFFLALEILKIARYYFFGTPEPLQGPPEGLPKPS